MHKVTPTKNDDGTETVKLYGTTVDVTGKKTFTLFKREYKVERPKAKSKKTKVTTSYEDGVKVTTLDTVDTEKESDANTEAA